MTAVIWSEIKMNENKYGVSCGWLLFVYSCVPPYYANIVGRHVINILIQFYFEIKG